MISKLLKNDRRNFQLLGAGIGTVIGIILLLGITQFWYEMKSIIQENRDLIDPEFMVVNKQVSFLETFNLKEATFSDEEIRELREQPWAENVEGFISNQFALSAYTDSKRFPDFYTDLFFEAVPDRYLDVKDERWKWEKGQKTIPVILPQDYLNLYNFGFAPSQGLPQISPNTISLVNFTISIYGQGEREEFRGKIIGFSSRINSILVPWDFLEEANRVYGRQTENKISRVVVVTNDPANPAIIRFLDDHNYETIREKLKSSRLNVILKFVISFLGTLGIFIILLAFLVFVLSFQLIISRSVDKIRKLKWLGYSNREIASPLILNFALIILIISAISGLGIYLLKTVLNNYTQQAAFEISSGFHPVVIAGGILLLLVMFLINALLIYIQAKKAG